MQKYSGLLRHSLAAWGTLRKDQLAPLNAQLREAGFAAIDIPAPDQIKTQAPDTGKDLP